MTDDKFNLGKETIKVLDKHMKFAADQYSEEKDGKGFGLSEHYKKDIRIYGFLKRLATAYIEVAAPIIKEGE